MTRPQGGGIAPTKQCRWPACQVKIPGRFDYCRAHWFSLPADLRGERAPHAREDAWIADHLHNLREAAKRVQNAQQGLFPPAGGPTRGAWSRQAMESRPAPLAPVTRPVVKPYPTEPEKDDD